MGRTWRSLAKYIVQFSWAIASEKSDFGVIPKRRIILAYEPNGRGNQVSFGWNRNVHVVMSDDFFTTNKTLVEQGNKFLISEFYIFVARVQDQTSQDVQLMVSPSYTEYGFKPAKLPSDRLLQHSYTILDSSEGQVFLSVDHKGEHNKYGNIYISVRSANSHCTGRARDPIFALAQE